MKIPSLTRRVAAGSWVYSVLLLFLFWLVEIAGTGVDFRPSSRNFLWAVGPVPELATNGVWRMVGGGGRYEESLYESVRREWALTADD